MKLGNRRLSRERDLRENVEAKAPSFYLKRDPQTDAEWQALAEYLGGSSGEILKEQTALADRLLAEIDAEESGEAPTPGEI